MAPFIGFLICFLNGDLLWVHLSSTKLNVLYTTPHPAPPRHADAFIFGVSLQCDSTQSWQERSPSQNGWQWLWKAELREVTVKHRSFERPESLVKPRLLTQHNPHDAISSSYNRIAMFYNYITKRIRFLQTIAVLWNCLDSFMLFLI